MDLLNKENIFAVIGVSENHEKYGYKVFFYLKQKGYKVYPINPKYENIDDVKCYPNLNYLPSKPDVVICVVPPEVTNNIVKEMKDLNLTKVWMQPGSESDEAIKFCNANNIEVISNMCIMKS